MKTMPHRITPLFVVVCTACLASHRVAAADDGWIDLFNGTTLSGWHVNPERIGHGSGGRWVVKDGAIVGTQDPPGNGGILLTDRKFGDFELSLEMWPDWGVDSGLFLRSNDRGQCWQMMVDYHDAGNVGHIYGEGIGGFNNRPFEIVGKYDDRRQLVALGARPTNNPAAGKSISGDDFVQLWKLDDWNEARVRIVGDPPEITTWINGQQITHFDGHTFAGAGYNAQKVSEALGGDGSIAVQIHGGEGAWPKGAKCRWRNVRVKPL